VHLVDELRQRRAQFGDGGLDRIALDDRRRRFTQALRNQRRDQPVALGALLLDRFDVEAEAGQRFRQQFEILIADCGFRIGIGCDLLLAELEQPIGFVETEDPQRAANLRAVLGQRREIGALVVVAEERVEHLLHVPQVRLDLAAHLREQHALLRTLAHFVQHRRAGRRGEFPLARRIEPREHCVDLLRKVVAAGL